MFQKNTTHLGSNEFTVAFCARPCWKKLSGTGVIFSKRGLRCRLFLASPTLGMEDHSSSEISKQTNYMQLYLEFQFSNIFLLMPVK